MLKNLKVSTEPDFRGTIQNLHPEITFSKDEANTDLFFPSLPFLIKKKKPEIESLRVVQKSIIDYNAKGDAIIDDCRLLSEERYSLLKKERPSTDEQIIQEITKEMVTLFELFIHGIWDTLYKDFESEVNNIKGAQGFAPLKSYLDAKFKVLFIQKGYQLISSYLSLSEELELTLIQQKCGDDIEEWSSTVAWDRIEMFYGNLYEIYGDLLIIPTTVNNLIQRGDYTLFQTAGFTLPSYEASDKAGRCKNFSTNTKLNFLEQYYVAAIRNGTHHRTATINQKEQKILLKTGRSGATLTELSFVNYIAHCNELFARSLILLKALHYIRYA